MTGTIRAALVEVGAEGPPTVLGPLAPSDAAREPRGAGAAPPVAHVVIDREERRGALDTAACLALASAVEAAALTPARLVVLTGAGGHFCAGADLGGVEDDDFQPALRRCLQALVCCPLPVLVGIDGACLGAGLQLALAADLRLASAGARLGVPAAKLGLSVDHWTVARASALLGRSTAAHLLLTGEEVSGQRAHDLGFVHRLGASGDALLWAGQLARLAPLTLRAHKLGLEAAPPAGMRPEDQDPAVAAARAAAWASADLAEGKAAFAARRPPRFLGR